MTFFYLIGDDILKVVEEYRLRGKLSGALNATFIALITKRDKPISFNDCRTISLCNVVYNIITKIIANNIKPFLSKFMSKEQFGFLNNRKILDGGYLGVFA